MKICVLDVSQFRQIPDELSELIDRDNTLIVLNKSDLSESSDVNLSSVGKKVCKLSCKTGNGFQEFMKKLEQEVKLW